ncbi:MAG: hypothetical protein ACYC8T_20735 [Myxococcaceae bacterium]
MPSPSAGDARSLALLQAAVLLAEGSPRLKAVLSRLGELMGREGPLCKIRFDWPQLEEAIAHVDWRGELDERRERVLRKVVTRPFVERAMREYHEALDLEGLSGADLEAIAVGYSMLDISLADRRSLFELNPVLKVLLHVQAAERVEARNTFFEKMSGLTQSVRDKTAHMSLEADPRVLAEISELIEGDGKLRARLERVTAELHGEIVARFRSDDAPQEVLTIEEHLWVLLHFAEAVESLPEDEISGKAAAQLAVDALAKVLDEEFDEAISGRLRARANDTGRSRDERLQWELLRSAHEVKPTVFVLALVSGDRSRPLFRSARERELHQKIETAEALGLLREVRGELERAGEARPAKLLHRVEEKFFAPEHPAGSADAEAPDEPRP